MPTRASCAGLMILSSIILTSSSISFFKSLYWPLSPETLCICRRGVSTGRCAGSSPSLDVAIIGWYRTSSSWVRFDWYFRISVQASLQALLASMSYRKKIQSQQWARRSPILNQHTYSFQSPVGLLELCNQRCNLRIVGGARYEGADLALQSLHFGLGVFNCSLREEVRLQKRDVAQASGLKWAGQGGFVAPNEAQFFDRCQTSPRVSKGTAARALARSDRHRSMA